MSTSKRGRILRDTSAGEGLVFVEGAQHAFRLEGMWKSEHTPKVNMPVDVEFNDQGQVIALRSVSGQAMAGEQASQALDAAQDTAKKLAAEFQTKGLPALLQTAQRMGYGLLGALGALLLGWFVLPAASMNLGMMGNNSVTFYQGLKLLNSGVMAFTGTGGAGFYGFLCFAALLGVFLPQVWKDRRAGYAMAAPLALMLLVLVIAYMKASSAFSTGEEAAGALGGAEYQQMAKQMADQTKAEMMKAFSIGIGTWLSLIASVYLAWQGWKVARRAKA
jgi:hypothetical protein